MNNKNEGSTTPCISVSQGWSVYLIALAAFLAIGCSKSNPVSQVEDELRLAPVDPDALADVPTAVAMPTALFELQAAPALLTPVPVISSVDVLAESGLQVAYTSAEQSALVPSLVVEDNWVHMQTCLNQVGVAPLVLVRSAAVSPFTTSDDVVFTMDGIPAATVTQGATPVIQIEVSDFLIAGNSKAYNLRSIMGRLLWSTAGLLARDYPFSCAQQWIETE